MLAAASAEAPIGVCSNEAARTRNIGLMLEGLRAKIADNHHQTRRGNIFHVHNQSLQKSQTF